MEERHRFFATSPKGIGPLLADELKAMGAENVRENAAGASFEGTLEAGYRACLWSRTANRVLMPLAEFSAPDPEALYAGVMEIPWAVHLEPNGTMAVDFTTRRSKITHTRFGALKVKDAVVDQLRESYGIRPSVDTKTPDLRLNLFLDRDRATLSLDLSGTSLHQRGNRKLGGAAPLKENLAAALLLRAGWPEIAAAGGALVDPMCGIGTFCIEAALIAGDAAPGMGRDYFGFLGWKGHQPEIWEKLLAEAKSRHLHGLKKIPPIVGYDADPKAVHGALANVAAAGLTGVIHAERRELSKAAPNKTMGKVPGLVAVNPPYGERLGEKENLKLLYRALGTRLREAFPDWKAAVFTGNPELGKEMPLRAQRTHDFFNGALACKLLRFEITPDYYFNIRSDDGGGDDAIPPVPDKPGSQMVANRLKKNLKTIGKWAKRSGISCYRLYDADMPEYALAIDLYQGEETWVHAQEYAAPATVDEKKAERRLKEALAAIPGALGIPRKNLFLKVRRRQKGKEQYEKQAVDGAFYEVREGAARFMVNFTDYLDTGLFLDHRATRLMIGEMAKGKRFLNLFGYTGTASVHAALGGAKATVTVDMSKTYLNWAAKNFALNGFSTEKNRLERADCLPWLAERAAEKPVRERFDLIFLDPPTFSTSKKMENAFDVQRDHVALIKNAMRLLEIGGTLLFSNNFRRFKMDFEGLASLTVEELTHKSLPKDFERNPRIHNLWKITRKGRGQ